jgi:hypothetical protein
MRLLFKHGGAARAEVVKIGVLLFVLPLLLLLLYLLTLFDSYRYSTAW